MLADTGAQKARRVVRDLAQLLLDGLIDHRSARNIGLDRLAGRVFAIAAQHTGEHFRECVIALLAGVFASVACGACLLASLCSFLGRAIFVGEPIGTRIGLLPGTVLLITLLAAIALTLMLGRPGLLLLRFAGTGLLVLRRLRSVLLTVTLWRTAILTRLSGRLRLIA